MFRAIFVFFLILLNVKISFAQEKRWTSVGFNVGIGEEFKNRNYLYKNHYYKLQFYKVLAHKSHNIDFEFLVQPEVNFSQHQLLNKYFVEPDEPNYIEQREIYTKLKNINQYSLSLGFLIRKKIDKRFSCYTLFSLGAMYHDTQIERLSKGFTFLDVFSLGVSYKTGKISFDVRPALRHVSNAGLQGRNAGLNTKNIEFGFAVDL